MKILFTSALETSFVREDLNLLRKSFDVEFLKTNGLRSLAAIPASVARADLTYSWFASTWSWGVVTAAKTLGKGSILVVGGVDVARCPEIGYGIWLTPWKARLVGAAMRKADRVLAVDPFLGEQVRSLAEYAGENVESLPTGYDPSLWKPGPEEKHAHVLTIASCDDPVRMRVKGIPFLLAAAGRIPEVRFTLIGLSGRILDDVRRASPRNMEVIPFVPRERLLGYYQQAAVYCQPSYFEGFPNSVCEAMLCECVPVGSDVGGMASAIGDTGLLVRHGDVDGLVNAVREALRLPPGAGKRARDRIAQHYTLEIREQRLLRIIGGLAG